MSEVTFQLPAIVSSLLKLSRSELHCSALTVLDEDKFFRTISLDVEFYKPIKKGVLNITGAVSLKSKTRFHCQISFEQDGKLMA